MNTPAHLILGVAAFARPAHRPLIVAAIIGALMPDLSLYVMGGVALFLLRIPPERVFNEFYFSDAWQTVFAIDNSFVVWGTLLALSLWRSNRFAIVFCSAALLHLAFDFPLHHDDGRPHFWPMTGWVFESPVSYWDVARGARWIAPLEAALVSVAAVLVWRRVPSWGARVGIFALLCVELWIVREWLFFFQPSVA